MGWMFDRIGHLIARLQSRAKSSERLTPDDSTGLRAALRPGEPHVLIEANLGEGVVSAPLSKYLPCKTRICRSVGLSEADCEKVCRYACERVGLTYDFKNAVDLMRYLLPSPMTRGWRHRTIVLGSGDASRMICSSLIAQAFDIVRYPILPKITRVRKPDGGARSRRAPSLITLCAPRLRYFALLHGGEAHARARLQLQRHALGRSSRSSRRIGYACCGD